jgi:hypothetical protein
MTCDYGVPLETGEDVTSPVSSYPVTAGGMGCTLARGRVEAREWRRAVGAQHSVICWVPED